MASDAAPSLEAVAARLADALTLDAGATEPAGVWIASGRPVRRLGLVVQPGPPPYAWADGLDALLVHRPFGLWPARLPPGLGVLAYHGALDRWLWGAPAWGLAAALGVDAEPEPLCRDGQPVGVVGPAAPGLMARIANTLGGVEATLGDLERPAIRAAVVGAMTDALIREAAARGVTHFVTGQIRRPGVGAAEQTGLAVVAVGQHRTEAWALRQLGAWVRDAWPAVEIVTAGHDTAAPAETEAAGDHECAASS